MKAMTFRSLMSVLELADDDHTRWFVREQMTTATLDDLLEIK
jgi:hypothetical protein